MASFDKPKLDGFFGDLRERFGNEPDWEDILRDAHIGVARNDAGVELGELDRRVLDAISRHAG
jgi:hypothetical protein